MKIKNLSLNVIEINLNSFTLIKEDRNTFNYYNKLIIYSRTITYYY